MTDRAAVHVESPCVRECVVDEVTGYCVGCQRTLHEICHWTRFTPGERQRVAAQLAARRAARSVPAGSD